MAGTVVVTFLVVVQDETGVLNVTLIIVVTSSSSPVAIDVSDVDDNAQFVAGTVAEMILVVVHEEAGILTIRVKEVVTLLSEAVMMLVEVDVR